MDVKSVSKPTVVPTPAPKYTDAAQKPLQRIDKPPEHKSAAVTQTAPPSVINTQGQQIGRHVNVSA
jgi:hypothetical protein